MYTWLIVVAVTTALQIICTTVTVVNFTTSQPEGTASIESWTLACVFINIIKFVFIQVLGSKVSDEYCAIPVSLRPQFHFRLTAKGKIWISMLIVAVVALAFANAATIGFSFKNGPNTNIVVLMCMTAQVITAIISLYFDVYHGYWISWYMSIITQYRDAQQNR